MSFVNEENGITVFNGTGQKIEVLFQEEVQLDINVPLFYIKSGEEEIQAYVNNHAKPDLEDYTQTKKQEVSEHTGKNIEKISEKTAEDIETAKAEINIYVENTAEPALQQYSDETIKPQLETIVSEAETAAGNAAASAENAQNSSVSASSFAAQAESSALNASDSAETTAGLVETARKWAVGTIEEQPEGSSEYWAGEAKVAAENADVGYELFQPAWFDHKPESASWLRADTFSWQDGGVYFAAYNELASQYADEASAETTDTVDNIAITYKKTPKGYKICAPEQAENIAALYESTGVAWYYILDTENGRFKLPRTKWGFVGSRNNVGAYVPESLPNITGAFSTNYTALNRISGGFYQKAYSGQGGTGLQVFSNSQGNIEFDASRCSSAYQDGAPVQQRAVEMYLYFFVGNTIKNDNLIDVGEIAESLNDKVDSDCGNLSAAGKVLLSSLPMASEKYTDLALQASGASYTAPANGWVVLSKTSNAANQFVSLEGKTAYRCCVPTASTNAVVSLAVKKDDVFTAYYDCGGTLNRFRFYYAEGEN